MFSYYPKYKKSINTPPIAEKTVLACCVFIVEKLIICSTFRQALT